MTAKNYTLEPKCKKCSEPIQHHAWYTLDKDGRFICTTCKPGRQPIMAKPKRTGPRCKGCDEFLEDGNFREIKSGKHCLSCLGLARKVKV